MATNRRVVRHSSKEVWAALADGRSYAKWVVGTSIIRDVDDSWPEPGSRLLYRVGHRPLNYEGHTEVLALDPGRRLELQAHAPLLGSVHIELTLDDVEDGCAVTIVEHPDSGPLATLHTPFGDLLLKLRNVEALRRLESVVGSKAA